MHLSRHSPAQRDESGSRLTSYSSPQNLTLCHLPHNSTSGISTAIIGGRTLCSKHQVGKSDYVDPRWKEFLGRFTFADGPTRLSDPQATGHGRYWYNLHLVIVVQDRRYPIALKESFRKIREACPRIAAKKGYDLAEVSIMPDHVHIALRGNIEHSPTEIGLAFLNNLSFVLGYNRVWSHEFYVGTFSEYSVQEIGGRTRTPQRCIES